MPERLDRRDVFALVALLLVGVGIPLWLSAAARAIGIPSNDDWVYMRGAESLFRTGSIDMPGHTAAAIGQVVLAQPLLWLSGGNHWAFTAFGLVMASIGIGATYLLARRFVGTGSAVLVALLVIAFPGFARESAAFMTDVPAFALMMLCLLLGTRWLQGDGGWLTLLASLAAGVLGVSIREFAIAAPLAILVAAWVRNRADERAWLAALSGLFAAGVVGVLAVAGATSGHGTVPLAADPWRLAFLWPAFATLAAVLLPAIAVAGRRGLTAFSPGQILLATGLLALMFVLPVRPLLGNYWHANGVVGNIPVLAGTRDPVIGAVPWAMSELLAVFAAIILAALAIRWTVRNLALAGSLRAAWGLAIRTARSREGPLVMFLLAYAAEMAVFASLGSLFDRYLYPMVPAAAILLLRGPARLVEPAVVVRPGWWRAFSFVAVAWLAVSALATAANSFAYDAARWSAGNAAVAMGYDARTVDAGLEWVQYHGSGVAVPVSDSFGVTPYDDWFMTSRPCSVVANTPLDLADFRLLTVDRAAYLQYLLVGPVEPLYLYGSLADGCPKPAAAGADETETWNLAAVGK